MMGAALLKAPEFEIEQAEAERLAVAVAKVNEAYDFVISPQVAAWGNLIMVCGGIYGPRIMAAMNNRSKKPVRVMPGPGPGPEISGHPFN
jgi:crotonobetainyl-CoA:carnitine CoA-transferase CaiB-like acyl-CoA transferase